MSRAIASRYQPVLVALHWLLALMIIGLLCLGFFVLADMPNTDPKKLVILVWHMTGGMFVLVYQFVLKDGLFRRMWFGERTIVPAENVERGGQRPLRRA